MKQRKATKGQPKKVILGQGHSLGGAFAQSSNKQPSGHTKMSTNYTIHSSAFEQARKQKKATQRSTKENPQSPSASKLPHSKSSKKLKINLQQHQLSPSAEPSYREYCLIDESFVPVANADEQKMLEDFLSQTAATSSDFACHLKTAPRQPSPIRQLRKRAVSRDSRDKPAVQKVEASTSVKRIEYSSIDVLAIPESVQIGLQYSERPVEKPVDLKEEVKVEESQKQEKVVENESLSELLFKLQFSHLGDEKSFSNLSSNEKEHFSQLLETFVTKLKGPQIKPITFPSESYSPPTIKNQQPQFHPNYEQLQRLVCLRECHQMNWMQVGSEEEQEVHTSLYSVVSFLCHLFCFIEMHYSEEFVYMIQKIYGHTYREKYRRITRGIPLIPDRKFKVIQESIFLQFIKESNTDCTAQEIAHMKAIFDAFNEHLEEYRPFFLGNGQQFPWAMKMFVSMSEYSINEDSLQIIFLQAKEKMVEWCSMLCGLLVDHKEKVMLPSNPLEVKRKEREDKLVGGWLKEENFEKDGIELYCTQALHDAAELIYQQLVNECLSDMLLS